MQEEKQIEKAKSYAPTEAMKRAAERGLKLRAKYGRGGLDTKQAAEAGVGSGVARARDILNGNLSLESVKRMHAFFSRHASNIKNAKTQPDGGPGAAKIASDLWGGSAGEAWARGILRQEGLLEKSLEYREDVQVIKATNEELKLATFVVLVPDEADLHGDIYDELTVLKACNSYNKHSRRSNLFHKAMTDTFTVVQSWISPVDVIIEDRFIKKGTWLCTIECNSDSLWQMIKSGEIDSVSIGAMAQVEAINDEE